MNIFDKEKLKELLNKKRIDDHEELLIKIENLIINLIKDHKKKIFNKKRMIKINDSEKKYSVASTLTKQQIKTLPKWIKKDIKNFHIIGNTKKTLLSKSGKKYHLDNKLNDLSGAEWIYFLRSVINTRYPTSGPESYAHDIRKVHPTPKPPQLMRDLISFFSKENEYVLDYFMGVGGTLLGASLCNRKALGIDLNKKFINAYKKANAKLKLNEQTMIHGDSIEILKKRDSIKKYLGSKKFSIIIIDPPYGEMMSKMKTGEAIKQKQSTDPTPFTKSNRDLGNLEREEFYNTLIQSIDLSSQFLKDKGHFIIFTKDMQPKDGQTNLLHSEIIERVNKIKDINYLGMKIWADESINLYPYGYAHGYVSNQLHQYIMIFQKKS